MTDIRAIYPRQAGPGAIIEIVVSYGDGTHGIFAPGDKWFIQFIADASRMVAGNVLRREE